MKRIDIALIAFGMLAVAQLSAMAFRSDDAPKVGVVAGAVIGDLVLEGPMGTTTLTPDGTTTPTVVLAFRSTCAHCETVAPDWRRWLAASGDRGFRVLAVSNEPLDDAEAYAEAHEWPVDIYRPLSDALGSVGQALTARTPWVFVVDADGVVQYEGHGARLTTEADSILKAQGVG